jgi:hypothetical protein
MIINMTFNAELFSTAFFLTTSNIDHKKAENIANNIPMLNKN